eukprot:3458287-Prymnesium_polylepis.1
MLREFQEEIARLRAKLEANGGGGSSAKDKCGAVHVTHPTWPHVTPPEDRCGAVHVAPRGPT